MVKNCDSLGSEEFIDKMIYFATSMRLKKVIYLNFGK